MGAPWSAIAAANIDAAYGIIKANHPGPVNTENAAFGLWLEQGRASARMEAAAACSRADAMRALLRYVNGFRDGHLKVVARDVDQSWPGFLTTTDDLGRTSVTVSSPDTPVPFGTEVLGCDGQSVSDLLESRVYPYLANAAIPHQRALSASHLFTIDADDPARRFNACQCRWNGEARVVPLSWVSISANQLRPLIVKAQSRFVPELGLRETNGVRFVSIPSFQWFGAQAHRMQDFVDELTARAAELHAAPIVVLDVRGNTGGNSGWGTKVLSALWGEATVAAIGDSADDTAAWRTSALNAELTRAVAERMADAGFADSAALRLTIAAELDAARNRGEPLYLDHKPASSNGLRADYRSPFRGNVFLLTDPLCASACLDFADILHALPEVTFIGLPTSADTLYMDNVEVPLADGFASLSYSLKVYRGRKRGANVWYEPDIRWPGGEMTDPAIADWVRRISLDQRGAQVTERRLASVAGGPC